MIGHKRPDVDSIVSAISYAEYKHLRGEEDVIAARAGDLDEEVKYVLERFNFETPYYLTNAVGKKLILVDHNEVSQAVDGVGKAHILEIIDHHRLGGMITPEPIFVHIEPLGSTSTIITEFYLRESLKLTKEIAGLLLCGILSDTIVLKSPTCTERDRYIAKKLSSISGVDINEAGNRLLELKSLVAEKSAKDIILSDFKEFVFGKVRVGISHIEVLKPEELLKRKDELLQEMKSIKYEKQLNMIMVMITDILRLDSYLLCIADNDSWFERIYKVKLKDNIAFMPGVSSRKKHLVPPLVRFFTH